MESKSIEYPTIVILDLSSNQFSKTNPIIESLLSREKPENIIKNDLETGEYVWRLKSKYS
jgi:hypothetical protein